MTWMKQRERDQGVPMQSMSQKPTAHDLERAEDIILELGALGLFQDSNRPICTIAQACELADVSRRTMYNWIDQGKVEAVRAPGGRYRIYRDSLCLRPGTEAIQRVSA
jgi:excisionase family DNA binding protein